MYGAMDLPTPHRSTQAVRVTGIGRLERGVRFRWATSRLGDTITIVSSINPNEEQNMTYDPRPAPDQTIDADTRVLVTYSGFAYGSTRQVEATIIDYATPALKEKQMWTHESYFVRFDNDRPHTSRVFSIQDIEVL